jgi:hypothetical protein
VIAALGAVPAHLRRSRVVRIDTIKIDYCAVNVAGNPTMSGGGGRKDQNFASFF